MLPDATCNKQKIDTSMSTEVLACLATLPDGRRAHHWHPIPSAEERSLRRKRRKRDALELAVFKLRDQKATLPEGEYFDRLELLLVELAELYDEK